MTMTYEEFNKEIEKLGLIYHYDYCFVVVYHPTYRWYPLAYVSQETLNSMATTSDISQLPENVGNKLLEICYELARTPLDERKTVILD